MKPFKSVFVLVVLLGIFAFYSSATAQRGSGMKIRGNVDGQSAPVAELSRLKAIFSDKAKCIKIASPYGSPTRYDGSQRPRWAPGGGTHGGIDLTLTEKTPLLAIATGTVTKTGQGGMMEGIYIWLWHAPEDTGLNYWVHSKYQHLDALSDLKTGTKVTAGQVIGLSGKTGTVGGHYGGGGYPHLHLTTRKSIDGELAGGTFFDPLEIYRDAATAANGGMGSKKVAIPYVTNDGRLWPENTRVVWPVACQPN